MPQEIKYNDINEAIEVAKEIAKRASECRIKVNKKNVKLKLRTKKKLYTIVLTPEKLGLSSIEEVKNKAREIANTIGCTNIVEIE